MKLYETIAQLRNAQNLSQGEVAEKLNVSRQSVSKWETGASVPDITNLVLLSELFGVTLDRLVKDEGLSAQPSATQSEQINQMPQNQNCETMAKTNRLSTQKIIAIVLWAVGGSWIGYGMVISGYTEVFGFVAVICGIILFFCGRYAGFILLWLFVLFLVFVSPYLFGITLGAIFNPDIYLMGAVRHLIIGYAIWGLVLLAVYLSIRKTQLKRYYPLIVGWIVSLNTYRYIFVALGLTEIPRTAHRYMTYMVVVLLIVNVAFTARAVIKRYKTK